MTNLMYNTKDDTLINRAQLHQVVTPPPVGRFHRPVPFGEYVEVVDEALFSAGFEVTAEEYAVTKDGQRFFGMLEVAPKVLEGEYLPAKEFSFNVGVRGSHDQSIPRGIALGTQVMVCSNLCFHGEMGTASTKQTVNIYDRIVPMVHNAVGRLPELMEHQTKVFDQYKDYQFGSKRHGDAALVEIFRRGGFSAPQLARAIKEWDNPSYEEHLQYGDRSAWLLFNACTEALKPTGGHVNMDLVRARSQTAETFISEIIH